MVTIAGGITVQNSEEEINKAQPKWRRIKLGVLFIDTQIPRNIISQVAITLQFFKNHNNVSKLFVLKISAQIHLKNQNTCAQKLDQHNEIQTNAYVLEHIWSISVNLQDLLQFNQN